MPLALTFEIHNKLCIWKKQHIRMLTICMNLFVHRQTKTYTLFFNNTRRNLMYQNCIYRMYSSRVKSLICQVGQLVNRQVFWNTNTNMACALLSTGQTTIIVNMRTREYLFSQSKFAHYINSFDYNNFNSLIERNGYACEPLTFHTKYQLFMKFKSRFHSGEISCPLQVFQFAIMYWIHKNMQTKIK